MRYKKDNFKNSQNSQKKACDSILLSKTVVEQLLSRTTERLLPFDFKNERVNKIFTLRIPVMSFRKL